MKTRIISSMTELKLLEPQWTHLFEKDLKADIFSSYEWFSTLWKSFGEPYREKQLSERRNNDYPSLFGKKPQLFIIVILDNNDNPISIFPFIRSYKKIGALTCRVLSLPITSHSPRSGLIISSGYEDSCIKALFDLIDSRNDWDILVLDGLKEDLPYSKQIKERFCRYKYRCNAASHWAHDFIELKDTWGDYLKNKSKKFRQEINTSKNRQKKIGEVSIVKYSSEHDLDKGVQLFINIDSKSWKATRGECVSSHPVLENFIRNLVSTFGREKKCFIWILSIDGKPLASFIVFSQNNIIFLYKGSFNDEYTTHHYSPSKVLLSVILEELWESEVKGFDFILHSPFTIRWATCQNYFMSLSCCRTTVIAFWLITYNSLYDALRRLRKLSKRLSARTGIPGSRHR